MSNLVGRFVQCSLLNFVLDTGLMPVKSQSLNRRCALLLDTRGLDALYFRDE